MDNVFITQSTFNIIVGQVDIDKIPKEFLGISIYDKTKIDYLYKNQFKTILAHKYLSENPDKLAIYKKNTQDHRSKNYFLIKISNPKFHLFADCESIRHRFENMVIPQDIREKGDDIIDEFRNYLLNEFGKFSAERYSELTELIVTKVNAKFKVNLSSNEIDIQNKSNTGSKKAKDLSLEELESKILKFAEDYIDLCVNYPDIFPKFTLQAFLSKKPEHFKFLPINYNNTNRKAEFFKILKDFYDKIQIPTYEYLKQYYMVSFNPELKFEGRLLEQLGLKVCLKCTEQANHIKSDIFPTFLSLNLNKTENYILPETKNPNPNKLSFREISEQIKMKLNGITLAQCVNKGILLNDEDFKFKVIHSNSGDEIVLATNQGDARLSEFLLSGGITSYVECLGDLVFRTTKSREGKLILILTEV